MGPALGEGHSIIEDFTTSGLNSSQSDGETTALNSKRANIRYCQGLDLGRHGFSCYLSGSCQKCFKESGEGLLCDGEFWAGTRNVTVLALTKGLFLSEPQFPLLIKGQLDSLNSGAVGEGHHVSRDYVYKSSMHIAHPHSDQSIFFFFCYQVPAHSTSRQVTKAKKMVFSHFSHHC